MNMKNYNWWLVSNSLIKRSVAVFWHYMLGYLIIMLCVAVPVGMIILVVSL